MESSRCFCQPSSKFSLFQLLFLLFCTRWLFFSNFKLVVLPFFFLSAVLAGLVSCFSHPFLFYNILFVAVDSFNISFLALCFQFKHLINV